MRWNLFLCIFLFPTCFSPTYGNAKGQKKDQMGHEGSNKWNWNEYPTVAVLGGIVAMGIFLFAVRTLGFTAAGVAAGSIAAAIQSVVYGGAVASTSIFAALQSIGAAGLRSPKTMGLFLVFAAAVYLYNKIAP